MLPDLDAFLVALYCIIDDLYREHFAEPRSHRPGRKPELSDSEVLTILILGQYLHRSERQIIRHAARHWRAYFPRLLSQSATNRRARDLAYVVVRLIPLLASIQEEPSAYEVLDSLPVPLMRRCRGEEHKLFGPEADVGRAGADRDFYYGCQLLLSVQDHGAITGFVVGPASTNVRWLAEDLLCWRTGLGQIPWSADDLPRLNKRKNGGVTGPKGPIWPREAVGAWTAGPYVADGGFSGKAWLPHWRNDYQALVMTPEGYQGSGNELAKSEHRKWRHVIETVNSHLEAALHLAFPLARCRWGLLARVAAKLAAFNAALLINRSFDRPAFAVATLFS